MPQCFLGVVPQWHIAEQSLVRCLRRPQRLLLEDEGHTSRAGGDKDDERVAAVVCVVVLDAAITALPHPRCCAAKDERDGEGARAATAAATKSHALR